MNGRLLEVGVEGLPECRALHTPDRDVSKTAIKGVDALHAEHASHRCGPSTIFRKTSHLVTGMSRLRMFRCFTSGTHASTSPILVKISSSSMSCMESRTRMPTFHRKEVSQLRFVRGPTLSVTEYTPSGIFVASFIHHDISYRVRSSTHVGR